MPNLKKYFIIKLKLIPHFHRMDAVVTTFGYVSALVEESAKSNILFLASLYFKLELNYSESKK